MIMLMSMSVKEAYMPATRRTQLLMDPVEFRQLRALARQRKTSVAELIRSAVREVYLTALPDRRPLVEAILALKLPKTNWKKVKKEIEAAHAGLS
jgi:hypothetical protein